MSFIARQIMSRCRSSVTTHNARVCHTISKSVTGSFLHVSEAQEKYFKESYKSEQRVQAPPSTLCALDTEKHLTVACYLHYMAIISFIISFPLTDLKFDLISCDVIWTK